MVESLGTRHFIGGRSCDHSFVKKFFFGVSNGQFPLFAGCDLARRSCRSMSFVSSLAPDVSYWGGHKRGGH